MGKKTPAEREQVIRTLLQHDFERADQIWKLCKSGETEKYVLTPQFEKLLSKKYAEQSVENRNSWTVARYGRFKDLPDIRVWDEEQMVEYCEALQIVCPILGVELTEDNFHIDR